MCDALSCVLLSAQYESNSLVTNMLFDVVPGLECDVVIGYEWISLCRMVAAELRLASVNSRSMLETTFEGVSMSLRNGNILVMTVSPRLYIADHASANGLSILHNILFMDEGHGVSISPFCASDVVLHEGCTLHGILVGPNWIHAQCASALLVHLFTRSCTIGEVGEHGVHFLNHCAYVSIHTGLSVPVQIVECLLSHVLNADHEYPLERLCAIACAIGWEQAREGLNAFKY